MPPTAPIRIYAFSDGHADGNATLRDLLGGKGANLADMTLAGLPVPPGFTIPTTVCADYLAGGLAPDGLVDPVRQAVRIVEYAAHRKFGDAADPLLLAVRSGAAVSMPGMMETVLNVGLNDETVEGLATVSKNAAFAYDCYRRLITMSAVAVAGATRGPFEKAYAAAGLSHDEAPTVPALKEAVARFKDLYAAAAGRPFPQDPFVQLTDAIAAVFNSAISVRAQEYRRIRKLTGPAVTAVTVQTMVFGNLDDASGTGVAFTRDPATGEDALCGEFLVHAQGEDLVAGRRTPHNCRTEMALWSKKAWRQLQDVKKTLEARYHDAQDFEFTVERGRLYLLQTRTAERTAAAAVRMAVEMANKRLIDRDTALLRVNADTLSQTARQTVAAAARETAIAQGVPASPGTATGKPAFTSDEAVAREQAGEAVLLVRPETEADDIAGMDAAAGVLTGTGGMTSHAAVVARGMGRPCVVGVAALRIDAAKRTLTIDDQVFGPADLLTIDGTTGAVFAGEVPTEPLVEGPLATLLKWADALRPKGTRVAGTAAERLRVAQAALRAAEAPLPVLPGGAAGTRVG